MILKLDRAGRPIRWVSRYEGLLLYCRDQVGWEQGSEVIRLRGGTNRRTGLRTVRDVNSIVAVRSLDPTLAAAKVPGLTNPGLFRRDEFMCMYCGEEFKSRLLTRDHVRPLSRGGADCWENAVTACRACNQRKDNRPARGDRLEAIGVAVRAERSGRTDSAQSEDPGRSDGVPVRARRAGEPAKGGGLAVAGARFGLGLSVSRTRLSAPPRSPAGV